MMMENKRCGELMIENHWMGKLLKEVLMIDELSIVETDKVNHTVEMDMLKLVVEVECFGKCVDEFDKVTVLFSEMQLKQGIGQKVVLELGINLKLLQWHLVKCSYHE
ncbi:hypothetical protein Tco_0255770 [Tanacetum coccineum]